MIRSRDLVVFVAVIFVLVCAIALTVFFDTRSAVSKHLNLPFDGVPAATTTYSAESTGQEIDRESIISRLRNALASNESEVVLSPSVEEATVSPETNDGPDTEAQTDAEDETGPEVECTPSSLSSVASGAWPLQGVTLEVEGAVRKVVHTQTAGVDLNASTTASSTPTSSGSSVLLQMPVSPVASPQSVCASGNAIGVTVTGSLMLNTDASFYRGYGPEYLIGYARDGFPIYGYYQGEVDQCGGYMHPQGYRYSVTQDRNELISCYKAAPAPFTNI